MSDAMIDLQEHGQKPVLVFFRWTRPGLPPFLRIHLAEQVTCLRQWFEVHVVDTDCDYDEICSRHEPDLCLFESGVYSGERNISRVDTHPQVPKLGFLHADAFDVSRGAFVADMINWGIEDFVTMSASMREYTPEIADRMFVWPNFIDPGVFHDYGLEKIVPVLFTGSQAPHYPWRNAAHRSLSRSIPTMTCPHFGWNGEAGSENLLVGERYARTLNASLFVPACGTITKDVVRKHFEVPATRSCLVAERTAALEAAGFEHLVNVVFAEPDTITEQLQALRADPELLHSITEAGHQLVHDRHTIADRDEIYRWFVLNSRLSAGERIVQDGPFDALKVVSPQATPPRRPMISLGIDRALIADAWASLSAGRAEESRRLFLRCLNYYFIPEAVLGAIRSSLRLGAVADARRWMDLWLTNTFEHNHAVEPDPVQWSTLVRIDLCLGDLERARADACRYPELTHPELDLVRAAVFDRSLPAVSTVSEIRPRATVTPVPRTALETWRADLAADLQACDSTLTRKVTQRERLTATSEWMSGTAILREFANRAHAHLSERARRAMRPVKRRVLSGEWERTLMETIRKEDLSEAVLIGGRRSHLAEHAVRQGLKENPGLPKVVNLRPSMPLPEPTGPGLVFVGAGDQTIENLNQYELIILDDAETPAGQRAFGGLLESRRFELLAHSIRRGRGRAVLRRAHNPTASSGSRRITGSVA